MKNSRNLLAITLSAPFLLTQIASAANSDVVVNKPQFTFLTSIGLLNVEDKDFDPEAFEAEVGIKGVVKAKEFTMIYNLKADLSDAINSRDTGTSTTEGEADIHMKEANVIFPTSYGAFVLAPRITSGQNRELYSNVDLFEYNEAHASGVAVTGNTLYAQPAEGDDVVAWASPKFMGVKLVLASISLDENNGEDSDAKAFRFVYDDGKLSLGAGQVIVNKNTPPAVANPSGKTYTRSALTAGYKFDKLDIGTTYEMNKDTFGSAGDYDTLGVAARYHLNNGYSVAAGYYNKDSDVDANDNKGTVIQVKKQAGKNISFWAEAANYDITADNFAVGVNLSY
ncbi:porin [Marinomonas transparens]|uniref:Porin n=1 Tax=Marinomonas transparens TaxID=2795388 RepID=A0A934JUA3_9GAMM|nr:porin [Marinomonas transparens]MBJ7537485.1 porin [Marinomonas transparens]